MCTSVLAKLILDLWIHTPASFKIATRFLAACQAIVLNPAPSIKQQCVWLFMLSVCVVASAPMHSFANASWSLE